MIRGFSLGSDVGPTTASAAATTGAKSAPTVHRKPASITAGTKYEFNLKNIMAKHSGKDAKTRDELEFLMNSLPCGNAPVGADFIGAAPSGEGETLSAAWMKQNSFNN